MVLGFFKNVIAHQTLLHTLFQNVLRSNHSHSPPPYFERLLMSLLEASFWDYIFLVVLVIYIRNYILLICAFPNIMFFEVIVKTILTK